MPTPAVVPLDNSTLPVILSVLLPPSQPISNTETPTSLDISISSTALVVEKEETELKVLKDIKKVEYELFGNQHNPGT